MSLVGSFAPLLRSGANDATRATNKLYALQKPCDCPIVRYHATLLVHCMTAQMTTAITHVALKAETNCEKTLAWFSLKMHKYQGFAWQR